MKVLEHDWTADLETEHADFVCDSNEANMAPTLKQPAVTVKALIMRVKSMDHGAGMEVAEVKKEIDAINRLVVVKVTVTVSVFLVGV